MPAANRSRTMVPPPAVTQSRHDGHRHRHVRTPHLRPGSGAILTAVLAVIVCTLALLVAPAPLHAAPRQAAHADETDTAHRSFLPLINGDAGVVPTPTPEPGEMVVSSRPYIVQRTVPDARTAEGTRCVSFTVALDDVVTAPDSALTQLTLDHLFTVDAGTVTVTGAAAGSAAACATPGDAPEQGARITTGSPGCTFALTPALVAAADTPGQVVFTCVYTESDDAVYFSRTTVSPEPFGTYDADYNQVQDALMPDANQRIIVLLPDGPSQADHNIFLSVGGRDVVDLPHLNMMIGTLSGATAQTTLRTQLGARALLIGADQRFDAAAVSLSRRSSGAVAAGPLNVPWRDGAVAPAATVNVTVAVLDTGVDATHPTLNNKIVASFDALTPGNFPDDIVGQGTHVAAIIAGETRSGAEPFEGVAPDANLAPVRIGTTDQWQLSDFLRGIDWVIQQRSSRQIAVANNSITVPGIQNPFWTVALRKLAQQGVLVVSAAGNNGDTVVGAPADDPAIITVGATNARADVLDDSSHGTPYMSMIKPDLLAPGSNIYSAKAGSTGYENRSGTEMAAPIVAGVAAQLIMRNAVPANGDEDDDGIPDNDPWNGRDDNRDDILDSDLGAWDPSAANLRTLKSLLLMSTADVPAAATASQTVTSKTMATKTTTSGFGAFDPQAMEDALDHDFCAMDGGTFTGETGATRVWIRRLYLHPGRDYSLALTGPADADYDLYLYRSLPDAAGNPVVARAWGSDRLLQATAEGATESIEKFRVREEGIYYAVVRHVEGAGAFTLALTDPVTWTILVYASAEMAGPDDLDQAAFDLLNQLETVGSGFGSTQEVQVLALIDYDRMNWSRTSRAQVDGVNDGDAAVYCVRKDLLTETSNRSIVLPAGRIFNRADNEVDMSAPDTLAGFIDWGLAHFPAARSALVLWGDPQGYGWKADPTRALGPGQDTRKSGAATFDADAGAFTIADLADTIAAGLPQSTDPEPAPIPLDLLVLDMGQMANLDVAYQFLDVANNLVAWETPVDRSTAAYADLYRGLLNGLRCGSDGVKWTCDGVRNATGAAVAGEFVSQLAPTPGQTLVALALNNTTDAGTCGTLTKLAACVSDLAANLMRGMDDPGALATPDDNAQVVLAQQVRAQTATMADRSFIDLLDFARRLADTDALDAISAPADAIVAALATPGNGPVRARSSGNADLGGISLFFPAAQLVPAETCHAGAMTDCGWDNPLPSPQLYADDDAIAAVMAAGAGVTAAMTAAGEVRLDFVQQKQWDEFLQRYYAPVAVVCARAADDTCARSLVLRTGETVTLDAAGSSDSDGATLRYYWDLELDQDSAAPLPDYGSDTRPLDEPCTEDCDRDGVDGTDDDADATGITTTWTCTEEGQTKLIRLLVHDDHNLADTQFATEPQRHWNVDTAQVTLYCAVEPQFHADADLLLNGARVDYQLVIVANPDVEGTVEGRLVNPLPPALALYPNSIEAAVGSVDYITATHTLAWTGPLRRDESVSISYQATVDNSLVPLDMPAVANQAHFFDGVVTQTLAITVPAVAVDATPLLVSPGDVVTYTVNVPARADQVAPEEVTLQYLGETKTAALDAFDATLPTAPSTFDQLNNILIWPAQSAPGQSATFRFMLRITDDAECGANSIRFFLWPPGQSVNSPSFTVGNCLPPSP